MFQEKRILLLLALVIQQMSAAPNNLIKEMVVEKSKLTIRVHDTFKERFLLDDFFIEYEDVDLEEMPQSIITLPFILTMISTVWASGETYYVDVMDQDVYVGLAKLKKIYKLMYPKTPWNGKLIPRKVVSTPKPAQQFDENTHVALLFSGGLDSTVTSLYHKHKKQLLITAWGQYDFPLNKPSLWETAKARFIAFGKQYGHENTFLKSNYSEIFNHDVLEQYSPEIPRWRMWTIEDIGWAGLTAPILYAKGYPVLLIASSDSWEYEYPSAANPFVDSTMNFAGIRLEHDLFDLTRFAKMEYLVNYVKTTGEAPPYLTICQQRTVHNCNDCGKCFASALALFAIGEHPIDYGFYTTVEEIRPRIEKYLGGELTSFARIERFNHIQRKIRERLSQGDKSARNLEWLLKIDLLGWLDNTYEKKVQVPLPWKKLSELCPEIEVPAYYLDPSHKHPLWAARDNEQHKKTGLWQYIKSLFS